MASVVRADLYVVLPVRGIAHGKSRLAPVLSNAQRAHLNRWLLDHTLDTLLAWRGTLQQCVVVSACADALHLASAAGARTVREDGGSGLNAAVTLAAAHARRLGAHAVLVVPCDLPALTPHALAHFIDCALGADVAIAPDKTGSGTNAMIVDAVNPFPFQFGPRSFAAHMSAAAARSLRVCVHRSRALELDLDTPEDLAQWRPASGVRQACTTQGPFNAMV